MSESNITAAMRDAIGRQLSRRVSYPVAESDIRRWAIAVYYPQEPPRQFWDEAYAKSTRYGGITAPEDFNPFAWMSAGQEESPADIGENDPDRTELMLGIPGAGLKFQLNGGMEVEYGARMRPGDVITGVSRLSGYTERAGRLGLMLFTVMEDSWACAAVSLPSAPTCPTCCTMCWPASSTRARCSTWSCRCRTWPRPTAPWTNDAPSRYSYGPDRRGATSSPA